MARFHHPIMLHLYHESRTIVPYREAANRMSEAFTSRELPRCGNLSLVCRALKYVRYPPTKVESRDYGTFRAELGGWFVVTLRHISGGLGDE